MAYRDFRDSSGTAWHAWDVRPQVVERRRGVRRRTGRLASSDVPGGGERRAACDRRSVRLPRMEFREGFAGGWLCFECADEKRRLTPIPPDWACCADARLAQYCDEASRVQETRRRAHPSSASSGGQGSWLRQGTL